MPSKVPIAPTTNLARKFLGTSHASPRAHDLLLEQLIAPVFRARHAVEQALISNEGIHAVQRAHDLTKVL